jgi:hypothetical protein
VGLGLVSGVAVFPYHGKAAAHLRERSVELLPADATLVGLDEHTALLRLETGEWHVEGTGVATVCRKDAPTCEVHGGDPLDLAVPAAT